MNVDMLDAALAKLDAVVARHGEVELLCTIALAILKSRPRNEGSGVSHSFVDVNVRGEA
jgi:hypothetical protein